MAGTANAPSWIEPDLDIAPGSALESAACLDVLVARKHLTALDMQPGKERLLRIVSMLTKLIETLLSSS